MTAPPAARCTWNQACGSPSPFTTYPLEDPPPGGQIVARMASIPHGNAVLAQGNATSFTGPPTLETAAQPYAGSVFPSFNSTPFGASPADRHQRRRTPRRS